MWQKGLTIVHKWDIGLIVNSKGSANFCAVFVMPIKPKGYWETELAGDYLRSCPGPLKLFLVAMGCDI